MFTTSEKLSSEMEGFFCITLLALIWKRGSRLIKVMSQSLNKRDCGIWNFILNAS
jgi:hypothetical protein